MLGAATIVFRETLEAALLIGIIAAATRGLPGRLRFVAAGIGAGAIGSLLVAGGAGQLADWAGGAGQELFNATVLGVAVVMLAWHNIWMSRHGRELAAAARHLGAQVSEGRKELTAVAVIVATTVLREGSETVLFMYGLASGGEGGATLLAGGALGLGAGVAAGFAVYAGAMRIPVKRFFTVTSALIWLLAGAMAGQMARFLIQGDLLPSLVSPLWDASAVLPIESPAGSLLHALVGYEATPSGMQVLFQIAALVVIALAMAWARSSPPRTSR